MNDKPLKKIWIITHNPNDGFVCSGPGGERFVADKPWKVSQKAFEAGADEVKHEYDFRVL